MITFDGCIDIRCVPLAVFDYLCDPSNAAEWQSGVIESIVTSDGPIGPGTTFDEIVKVGPLKVRAACQVTDYERARRLGFSADSGPLAYSGTYLFESRDGGTRLTVTGSGVMRGLWRLLEPMLAADVRRESRKELEQIKEIVEHRVVSAMEPAPVAPSPRRSGTSTARRLDMARVSKTTAEHHESAPGFEGHYGELDGYMVGFESYTVDADLALLFAGLPDDRCQSPHWGLVLRGKLAFRTPGGQEVFNAGDAYYVAPGHRPLIFAGTEIVEFSPAEAFQQTMGVVARNLAEAGA